MLRLGVVASSYYVPPTPPPAGVSVVAISQNSPYLHAWPWESGLGFGAKFVDPSPIPPVPPVGSTNFGGTTDGAFPSIAATPSGKAIFVACAQSPWIVAYRYSSLGWGVRYSDPTLPVSFPGSASSPYPGFINVSPDNQAVIISGTGNGSTQGTFTLYAWNDVSGFGAKYSVPIVGNYYGAGPTAFSPDGQAIAFTTNSITPLVVYRWSSSSGIGLQYSSPASLSSATSQTVTWTTNSSMIWYGSLGYYWNSTTGFGALQFTTFPDVGGLAMHRPIFSPDGQTVLLSIINPPYNAQSFRIYPWGDFSGFGAPYAMPLWISGVTSKYNINSQAYSPDNTAIISSSIYGISAGEFSTIAGFGAPYTSATVFSAMNVLFVVS